MICLFQPILPGSAVYKVPNGRRELVTKFTLVSANVIKYHDCRRWNIYGSNDNIEWTLIDTQTNQELDHDLRQIHTFLT